MSKLERHAGAAHPCGCVPGGVHILDTRTFKGEPPTAEPELTPDGRCAKCGGEVIIFRLVEADDWRAEA